MMNDYRNPYEQGQSEPEDVNSGTFGQNPAPRNYYDPNSGYYSYAYGSGSPAPQEPKPPKRKREGHSTGTVIVASLLAAVIGAVGGGVSAAVVARQNSGGASGSVSGSGSSVNTSNVSINVDETVGSVAQAVAQKCSQSVVGIRTTTSVQNFFYGTSESTGEGSGVIYSSEGYIITNYHVISSAVEATGSSRIDVYVGSAESEPYQAEVIGYNISSDLAVIKISADGLTPIELGDSDDLQVGQYAVTIGSPGGLEFMGSVTYGIISGLDRVVSTDSEVKLIQTDAAINPGNSGGALLDTKGRLIGINSSKIAATEYEGMGFAIPVNTVVEKCRQIIEKKDAPEPYVGLTVSKKYTQSVLNYYGYPAGAVVQSVDSGSPAEKAGLQRGDIITEFAGKTVSSYSLLEELIGESEPGSTVSVKLYRSGRYHTTDLTIGSNN